MKIITAHILEMAQSDIVKHIDKQTMDRIRAVDKHPQFSAYVLGQEGESHGALIVDGEKHPKVKKTWYESAIRGLFDKLNIGTKLFHNHTDDNSGRTPIGEMVGKALEYIGDKLSAVVINYIAPSFRNLGLDIASVEADLMISPDNDGVVIRSVNDVTGIALANSKFNQPGFAGATLLATVQEFAGGEKQMTVEEAKAFLLAQKVRPSDVFSSEVLKDDPVVITAVREATVGEYAHRKRTDEAFTKARDEWEAKEKKYQIDLKAANGLALKTTVKEKLNAAMEAKKLTPEQQAFIHDEMGDFTIDEPEKIDPELTKRLDAGLKRFDRLATTVFKTAKAPENGNGKVIDGKSPVFPAAGPAADPNDIKTSQAYKDLSI